MKAIQATALTGPAGLRLTSVPTPSDHGRVVVAVRAVGVNFPDLLMTYGKYQRRTQPPFVPGVEISGVVVAAPPRSTVAPGEEVVAFCTELGGYAEFVAVDPMMVTAKPPELDFAEAAALPANFQTVHFALTRRARVQAGQRVLVLGAAGGIGTAAIQIAKALGATVIAVARRQRVARQLTMLGADHVIPLAAGWVQQIRDLTCGEGIDHVVDPVGGSAFDDAIGTLASGGSLLVVGFASGEPIPAVSVDRLLRRNVSVAGVAWGEYVRTRPSAFADSMTDLRGLAKAGFRPYISKRYPLADAPAALTALEQGTVVGKAVVEIATPA
ncbi:NADPH:quinone oxidoreductase family protein [Nocardia sp. CA-151230]|uniref:NADPH:quinone oxidoreductase family protein n=1 Tax=Nocardia sp. CA-151230 TaxID=3239982 RepID=UPI003D8C5BC2